VQLVGEENFTQFERVVLLQTIDGQWRDHLSALDYLRQGIHLRGLCAKATQAGIQARGVCCLASCSTA
jgi:preprotein translocase subunit SecA